MWDELLFCKGGDATQLFYVNIALAKGVVTKDERFYQGKP